MIQFANTPSEEQETIINIDYDSREVYIYTSQKNIFQRLVKKLGQPQNIGYLKNKIVSGNWTISFDDKRSISLIISSSTLIELEK